MLTDIIKTTFNRLNKDGIPATPDMYRKYFCEEARKLGLYTTECNSINSLQDSLSYKNRVKLKKLNIDSMDNLLDLLITQLELIDLAKEKSNEKNDEEDHEQSSKQVCSNVDDLIGIVEIVKDALRPSVGNLYSEEIDDINKQITDNPELLTSEDTQEIIKKLVKGRASFDRRSIIHQTSELNFITDNISTSLNKSIDVNQNGSSKMTKIKSRLHDFEDIDFKNPKQTSLLKHQFMSIAGSIEDEAKKLSKSLEKETKYINIMSKKIHNLKEHIKSAAEDSDVDFLTQVYTKEGFSKVLTAYELDFSSNRTDYCGILLDLDRFDMVNRQFGFDAGDRILSTFAQLLIKDFHDIGKICRHGGDRFLILIAGIPLDGAAKRAIDILDTLNKSLFTYEDQKMKITMSGAVCIRSNLHTQEEFIDDLYKVLKYAKSNGKNHIEISSLITKQAL